MQTQSRKRQDMNLVCNVVSHTMLVYAGCKQQSQFTHSVVCGHVIMQSTCMVMKHKNRSHALVVDTQCNASRSDTLHTTHTVSLLTLQTAQMWTTSQFTFT